jgi:membrane fusion protein, multidrug efflux system
MRGCWGRLRGIGWVAACFTACLLAGRDTRAEPVSDVPVTVARVRAVEEVDPVAISGVLEAERRATLSFVVEGVVDRVDSDVGDAVAEGALLAALDPTPFRARVERAQAVLEQAERDLERAVQLRQSEIGSQSAIDELQTARRLAHAELDIARYNLKQSQLSAPFAGTIARRLIEPGEAVAPARPAFEIVSYVPTLKAQVGAPGRTIAGLRAGDRARVTVDAHPGRNFDGAISRLGIQANEEDGTFTVEVQVDNAEGLLLPGMVARVEIFSSRARTEDTGEQSAPVVVPGSSIVSASGGQGTVYVVVEGKAQRRTVWLDSILRGDVVVHGPLTVGELVVDRGAGWIREGATLRVVEEKGRKQDGRASDHGN